MKGELRVGGLAMIIRSSVPENNGVVVTLVENLGVTNEPFVRGERRFSPLGEATWFVKPPRPLRTEGGFYLDTGVVRARNLMPINDPDAEVMTEEAQEVEA